MRQAVKGWRLERANLHPNLNPDAGQAVETSRSKTFQPESAAYRKRINEAIDNILSQRVWVRALFFLFLWTVVFWPWHTLQSFETRSFQFIYLVCLLAVNWMIAGTWAQFIRCWRLLTVFLDWLEKHPIRESFSRLKNEVEWAPLIAKLPEHQFLISARCLDCLDALIQFDGSGSKRADAIKKLQTVLKEKRETLTLTKVHCLTRVRKSFIEEYNRLQNGLTTVASLIAGDLEKSAWQHGQSPSVEAVSAKLKKRWQIPAAEKFAIMVEEFLALRSLMFIRYVFRHLRNLLGFVVTAFVLSVISLVSYPFQAPRWTALATLFVFVSLGVGIVQVFAQMDRNAIISRLTDTKANELGKTFIERVAKFGSAPFVAVLATQFPSVGRLIFSWIQPVLDAMR